MIPSTIDHYEILEEIGSGGMGVVYRALDTRLNRMVALKFLNAPLVGDEDANRRFTREAQAASALDHPNICTIYDIRETPDGRLFIVGAYYSGSTIKEIIKEALPSVRETLRIVSQIASALSAAHKADIVHRDIKPANIIMADDSRPVLLDFGVAKLAGAREVTMKDSTVGTLYYAAPEQLENRENDQRADIWSLGVVLYQMVTGRLPFDGEYIQAVTHSILNQPPPVPSSIVEGLPVGLDQIIQKMLEKDPAARYQSMDDVLSAINRLEEGPATSQFGATKRHRRLSAVMFTDMVGYSSLIQRNEQLGLKLLEEHRRILREIFPKYDGREIDTAGDAFFVEFGSALAATEAAIEIQTTLHDRNQNVADDHRIILRIGLHLGDVIHVGDQVQGDGVNIAARMEPLATPGAICISEDIARQVHNKMALPIAPLGEKALKNIYLPMDAYRIVMPWEVDYASTKPFHEFVRRERDVRPSGRGRPRTKALYVGIGTVLIVAVLWLMISRRVGHVDPVKQDDTSSVIAILPFSVQGSTEYAYLGKGMVDLLSTTLDGAGELRSVDPRAVLGAVEQTGRTTFDPSSGKEIANRLGAGSFVLGTIVEIGGQFRINASLYSGESGQATEQGTVEGEAAAIFGLVDGLAAQLLVLDRSGPGSPVERLEEVTTSSFDALKYYLQGVAAFRAARFQEAAEDLQKAVALDSTFALAWYQLSSTAEWLFDQELVVKAAESALRHKGRLSERGRRLVEALYASKKAHNREALHLYRDFLARYPDDVEAWYQLGELQFHTAHLIGGVKSAESMTAWNQLLYFEPDQITALIHATRLALAAGDFTMVDSVSKRIFELEPAAERNIEFRAHLALREPGQRPTGDLAARLHASDDAMIAEVIWSLGSFRDSPAYARSVVPFLTDKSRPEQTRALGYVIDAYLLVGLGRINEARESFAQARSLNYAPLPVHEAFLLVLPFREPTDDEIRSSLETLRSWDADATPDAQNKSVWFSAHDGTYAHLKLYMIGLLASMDGRPEEAEAAAQLVEKRPIAESNGSLASDLARGIRLESAVRQGHLDDASAQIALLERNIWYQASVSSSIMSFSRERYLEGLVREEEGNLAEAIEALSYFSGHSAFEWIYISPAHFLKARIYEKQGNTEQAMHHYQKFVELWEDCDDEFRPMVDEAQRRIGELASR